MLQLPQHAQPVEHGEEEVEHDQVVPAEHDAPHGGRAVALRIDREPLRLQPPHQEGEDAGFILNYQQAHFPPGR